ncbi:ATP-dependent translocase ABCB1-like isoform X2 [Polypterus senegalus]|nr:ATP-dependent translocase ABCB1-like isoform X2 [Polypterus senegalus]
MSEEGKRNTENEDSIFHVYDNPSFQKEEENEEEFSENVNKKKKKKNKKEELAKSVGIFQLFHYADTLDIILMIIGLVCSAAHGVALPIMIVVFGQMTDSFVSSGIQVNITVNSTLNASSPDCPQLTGMKIQAAMTR